MALSFNGAFIPHVSGPTTGATRTATKRPLAIARAQASSKKGAAACGGVTRDGGGKNSGGLGGGVGTTASDFRAAVNGREDAETFPARAENPQTHSMKAAAPTVASRRLEAARKLCAGALLDFVAEPVIGNRDSPDKSKAKCQTGRVKAESLPDKARVPRPNAESAVKVLNPAAVATPRTTAV
ncbi:hypothetical protein [uncultured Rhodoblastus sp.]|uniref:hypothetical protein n=1 Tax=uncultured Rhodoblastus sp. TaxID=543037 RepID=UPI0025EDA33B|nr:hypothetical protein [uncultured Rhodoblastus sp.]